MENGIYTLHHQDKHCKARTGEIRLPHGVVKTPAFMPVGTNGTVKGIYHDDVAKIGYNLILGNTYHLYLRPGVEVLKTFDGLHKFSPWN
ncbi:MAG: tRNA-guanine transglycosylase, partial [Spirochaetales bacterium]|nr:tRNA-guanine transglycosylase [Spirochaetales bacterium]